MKTNSIMSSCSSTSSHECTKSTPSQNPGERWTPQNERFATMMAFAKLQAQKEHDMRETRQRRDMLSKPSGSISNVKLNKRRSNRRSAEICRAKTRIYVKMLEREVEKEAALVSSLQEKLLARTELTTNLMEQIRIAENGKSQCGNGDVREQEPLPSNGNYQVTCDPEPTKYACASYSENTDITFSSYDLEEADQIDAFDTNWLDDICSPNEKSTYRPGEELGQVCDAQALEWILSCGNEDVPSSFNDSANNILVLLNEFS